MKLKPSKRKRTVMSFIDKFPEPYKTQAIENAAFNVNSLSEFSAPCEVLKALFRWNSSPQGGDYWADFSKSLTL